MSNTLDQIIEKLKNETPEENNKRMISLRKQMNEAGTMTEELFEKVLLYVQDKETTDYETLQYFPQSINEYDFSEVFNYLDKVLKNKSPVNTTFPTLEAAFRYKDNYFIWGLTHGQGAHCSIRCSDYGTILDLDLAPVYDIISIDTSVSYRIDPSLVDDEGKRIK